MPLTAGVEPRLDRMARKAQHAADPHDRDAHAAIGGPAIDRLQVDAHQRGDFVGEQVGVLVAHAVGALTLEAWTAWVGAGGRGGRGGHSERFTYSRARA